jgi:subtilase family serine protease
MRYSIKPISGSLTGLLTTVSIVIAGTATKPASNPPGYNPTQIRHAYGFDQVSGTGAGQLIAIVVPFGNINIQKDVNAFCNQFKLPDISVPIYYPTGSLTKTVPGSRFSLATDVIVEWAHAMAPAANIAVLIPATVKLTDFNASIDYAVNTLKAKQVCLVIDYQDNGSIDTHLNVEGVTFIAPQGAIGNGHLLAGITWPADDPNVIGVGGTTLSLDSLGNVSSEIAWSGSNGGASPYYTKPAYQGDSQSGGQRGTPDVSFVGDPNTGLAVYTTGYKSTATSEGYTGWLKVGGNEDGVGLMAALIAVANQGRAAQAKLSLSGDPGVLYSAVVGNYSENCRDIITGTNADGQSAGTGYDFATGLGSPLAKMLP